jgi:outer membrane protein TolC
MNRLKLHSHYALAAVVTALALSPAGAEQIALTDALALARSNAPEIAAAESRVGASDARLRQARAYRVPALSLQETWMRTDSPAEAFALELNQERFSFPEFVSSDPNDPPAIESATTRLQVAMPLYTGGELSGRIRQADLALQAARENASWAGNGAVFAAAEAYIQLAQAREHVALLERALETVEAHVAMARAYTEQGMLVRSELLRAEVEQARLQDLLSEASGRARVAAANLSFRLGSEPDGGWELAPLPAPRGQEDVGELEVSVQRAGLMPKVGLVARHDLVDDTPFGSHGDSTSIMAVGNIDLWSGGRHRAAVRAARAEAEAARLEIERFADAVALEVENAYEQRLSAVERHATAVRAQQAAMEVERITAERFSQGVVKMIDVLDASTARRDSEMRELVARSDAHLALFRLAVRAGRRPEDVAPQTGLSLSSKNPRDEDR